MKFNGKGYLMAMSVGFLFILASIVSIMCLDKSNASEIRGDDVETPSNLVTPTKTPGLQPAIQPKTREKEDQDKRSPYLAENQKVPELSVVFTDDQLAKIKNLTKEITKEKDSNEEFKRISEIVKSIVEIVAIGVGSFWTYILFIRQRQKYPRANLRHRITHRPIGNGKLLLNIDAIVSNTGQVLVKIVSGQLRIQHVLPLPASAAKEIANSADPFPENGREYSWDFSHRELSWPLGPTEIEPGEENQFHYDCVLPDNTELIKIYTYYKNEAKPKREIGWNLTTVYDLKATEESKRKEDAMEQTGSPKRPAPAPAPRGPAPFQEPPKPK